MEAELFTIKCSINQVCTKEDVSKIVIVTDSIHAMKKIFDSKSHPYQPHTTAILSKLRLFFNTKQENFIVVATTRRNGTHSLLTSAKLSVGYLVVGITRELDKEPSLHYSSIYINYMWSVLQQY